MLHGWDEENDPVCEALEINGAYPQPSKSCQCPLCGGFWWLVGSGYAEERKKCAAALPRGGNPEDFFEHFQCDHCHGKWLKEIWSITGRLTFAGEWVNPRDRSYWQFLGAEPDFSLPSGMLVRHVPLEGGRRLQVTLLMPRYDRLATFLQQSPTAPFRLSTALARIPAPVRKMKLASQPGELQREFRMVPGTEIWHGPKEPGSHP